MDNENKSSSLIILIPDQNQNQNHSSEASADSSNTTKNNNIIITNNNNNNNNNSNNSSPTINKKRSREEFDMVSNTNTNTNTQNNAKFKGVVPQQNGNWGAQIYANHQRIWLGTFKTASLAAMAYDSAAIKLRTGDLHRNFPWTDLTLQEPIFQAHYSSDSILTMIKDGSYHSKFQHFVAARSLSTKQILTVDDHNHNHNNIVKSRSDGDYNQRFVTKLLFQKELTPSDVGKLNRLVIPKKFAVKYFPYISEENFIIDSDDVELVFYDREMTPWRFRYCYWKSSQSYVFTRGWNRFVKDNKLKANDVVTFYSRDHCNNMNNSNNNNNHQSFCLIDVTHHSNANAESTTTTTTTTTINKRALDYSNNHISLNGIVERKGFRLFGVDIN